MGKMKSGITILGILTALLFALAVIYVVSKAIGVALVVIIKIIAPVFLAIVGLTVVGYILYALWTLLKAVVTLEAFRRPSSLEPFLGVVLFAGAIVAMYFIAEYGLKYLTPVIIVVVILMVINGALGERRKKFDSGSDRRRRNNSRPK